MTHKILGLLLALTFSFNAQADDHFVGAGKFYDLIEGYKVACAEKCTKPFYETVVYRNGKRSALLSHRDLLALQKVAVAQSNIWIDTILEGDFYSEGNTQIDNVVAIFYSSTLVAYKITYSERAWYLGDCEYDGVHEGSLAGCQEGVIRESTFVAPDFKTFVRNSDEIADFH